MECKDSSRFIHLLTLRSEDHRQLSVESRFRRKRSGSLNLASTGDSGGQFVGPYFTTKVCKVFMMSYPTPLRVSTYLSSSSLRHENGNSLQSVS